MSLAVTVTVAGPRATGVSVTREPETDALATPGFDEEAPNLSRPPSASSTALDASTTSAPSPTRRRTADSEPTVAGGRFRTVTTNLCIPGMFESSTSVAVTVTTTLPPDSGVTVTIEPDAVAVATESSDEEEVRVATVRIAAPELPYDALVLVEQRPP